MHQTLSCLERKSIYCQQEGFRGWLWDFWLSCSWVTGLKNPLMSVKLPHLCRGQDHEVLPLGIWLRARPQNFCNDVVRQRRVSMNMPIRYKHQSSLIFFPFLTCIRALIKNRGFPNEATPILMTSQQWKNMGLPPMAPLMAPASTDVKRNCSWVFHPSWLLKLVRSGS